MADQFSFQRFDKEPAHPAYRISRWTFGLREVILIAIAGTLLVICLIMAGVLGRVNDQLANPPTALDVLATHYCSSKACLRTAARAASYLNKSVDPCENFYQFACGNYPNAKPFFPNGAGGTVYSDVYHKNFDRIMSVLEQPYKGNANSALYKAKLFFKSCYNMYDRQRKKGLPILQQVIPALGGWKVLGTWDSAKWDLNSALKKVQNEFMVFALYRPRPSWYKNERILELNPGMNSRWLPIQWLEHREGNKKKIEDYKKFIRRIGSLLVGDAISKLTPPQGNFSSSERKQMLDEFVNDSFTMVSQIAKLNEYRYSHTVTKMPLDTFSSTSGGAIDWTSQVTSMFDQAGVSGKTWVRIHNLKYFTGLRKYLGSLPEPKMKRILHNYLIWRVVEFYSMSLSWHYIHASRQLFFDLHGHADFSPISKQCAHSTQVFMSVAVGHLYITKFLSKENRDMAHEITDNIRLAQKEQVTRTPWMDDSTKKYAQKKIDQISFKIGYPEWMANQAEVDKLYKNFTVISQDFIGNMLRLRSINRVRWNLELQGIETNWHNWLVYPYVWRRLNMNLLEVSAGALQSPYYDIHQPHSVSFGALGAVLGNALTFFIGDFGQYYNIGSSERQKTSWWSNSSLTKYKAAKECVKKVYSNLTMTALRSDGKWWTAQVDASRSHLEAIGVTSGLRLAFLGYRDWIKQRRRKERMLPGLDMTPNQMLFLSFGQSVCEVESESHIRYYHKYKIMDNENRVNMVLGQLEEFSQAFQCKKKTKMNHALKCQYF